MSNTKLPLEFKKKWIDALRSGEYKHLANNCFDVANKVGEYKSVKLTISEIEDLLDMDRFCTDAQIASWIEENL